MIGVLWVNHHILFKRVPIIDRPLTLWPSTLLLLLCVTVFSFPTATPATYLRHGGSDAHIAAALYRLVVEGVGLTFFAITVRLIRHRLLEPAVPPFAAHAAASPYASGGVAIAITIVLAFVSAVLSLAIDMAIACTSSAPAAHSSN